MKLERTLVLAVFTSLVVLSCQNPVTNSASHSAIYSVTYSANGATSGSVPGVQLKTQGVALSLAANSGNLSKIGFIFAGWNTYSAGNGIHFASGSTYSIDADLVLFAKWTLLPTYSVSYSANGATGGSTPGVQTKTQGLDLALASNSGGLSKSGFTFAGWNTSATGNGTSYPVGSNYITDANLALFSEWHVDRTVYFSIIYDGNGQTSGTPPIDNGKYNAEDSAIVAINAGALSRAGFDFGGWSLTPTGTGSQYSVGSPITLTTQDVKLYAVWNTSTFSVNYDPNGATSGAAPFGSSALSIHTVNFCSVNSGVLSRWGFNFTGWNTSQHGTGSHYSENQYISASAGSAVVLYAEWGPLHLIYKPNGATAGTVPADVTTYGTGQSGLVSGNVGNLSNTGYSGGTFLGWNTESDGSGSFFLQGDYVDFAGTDVVLYAFWDLNEYSVTYNGNGNTGGSVPVDTKLYTVEDSVVVQGNPGNLTMSGSVFSGWMMNVATNGMIYQEGDSFPPGPANYIMYAVWK